MLKSEETPEDQRKEMETRAQIQGSLILSSLLSTFDPKQQRIFVIKIDYKIKFKMDSIRSRRDQYSKDLATSPNRYSQKSDIGTELKRPGEEFELARHQCDLFLENLKHLYNSRVSLLREYLDNTLRHIKKDHVLIAMREDPTLQEFVASRVKEIITDSIAAERELEIHDLMQDLAVARSEKIATENEIRKLSAKVMELERQESEVAERWGEEQEILRRKEQETEELKRELSSMAELSKSIEDALGQKEKEYAVQAQRSEQRIMDLKQELDDLRKHFEETYAELQTNKLDKNEADIQLSQTIQGLKEVENENKELMARLRETEKKVLDRQNEIKEIKGQKRELNEIIRQYEEELKASKTKLERVFEEKREVENRYKDHTEKYKELLAAEKEHYLEIIGELREKKRKHKQELKTVKDMLENSQKMRKGLEEDLNQKENDMFNMKKELVDEGMEYEKKMLKLKEDHEKHVESLIDAHKKEEVIIDISNNSIIGGIRVEIQGEDG
eukprot:TRINITY_DN1481_c0_g1_i1.p1 TRINITY_DN1481_c0_g1~~TRINITY_DN1481_c0_g1_i1.p1  ORF type:complete len:502 (+),score=113.61 TRINITY_DN1481_c0_g1_i1:2984-4489(+)